MSLPSGKANIQAIVNRSTGLWYYEFFGGVADTDWRNPLEARAADMFTLDLLRSTRVELEGMPLGINVSFYTAARAGGEFVLALSSILPRGTIVELTEHAFDAATEEEMAAVEVTCRALEAAGFELALDDCSNRHPFGEPELWARLHAKIIKIDLLSIGYMEVASKAIAAGMKLICESVESRGMELQAARLGAQGVQGYYVARPMALGTKLSAKGNYA